MLKDFYRLLCCWLSDPLLWPMRRISEKVWRPSWVQRWKVSASQDTLAFTRFMQRVVFLHRRKMTAIVVGGQLIDGKSMKNVTDDRMKKLTAIKFNELPLERAIKHVRGDGKRLLATFEDPNCGYCKRLAKDLLKLDNVTIYTFLYPILSEDSVRKSKQIWCSADRAKSWNDWMVDGKAPSGRDDCDTAAVGKNQEFGRKLNITGTPTMFLQTVSGFRGNGAGSY